MPLSMMAGRYASFLSVDVNSSKSTLPYLLQKRHLVRESGTEVEYVGCELESEGDGDVIAGGDGRRDEHVAEDAATAC